jgi:myo-inositol-1(or 4)-monophosphatase
MKSTAIKAAKLAGKVIMENYGKIGKITFKGNKKSLLTKVDIKAEKLIVDTIKKRFPHHNILGEESGITNKKSDYTWIIDPIDGTTNYAAGIPCFCVSIALVKSNKVMLGIIYNPLSKELFFAEKGKGSFLNNKKIVVSNKKNIRDIILGFSLPSNSKVAIKSLQKVTKLFPDVRAVRNSGSAALNLCNVASGRYDAYFSMFINPWDAAAGFLIVEEAKGKVTDFKGEPWDINTEQIIASNKILHEKLLKLLK